MDECLKATLELMPIDERIAWSRNVLYRWKTGWTQCWLLLLEFFFALSLTEVWTAPVWLRISVTCIAGYSFLSQRSWAMPNGLGFLNLFTVWPFQFILLVVQAPVFGPLWILLLIFNSKEEFGRFAAATDFLLSAQRRGICP